MKAVIARHLNMKVPSRNGLIHSLPFQRIAHNEARRYSRWRQFTIVRHPMRRILSLYNNKIFRDARTTGKVKDGVVQDVFGAYGSLFHAEMSFPDFVSAICQVVNENADPHFKRMSEQLPDAVHVDVLKVENMEAATEYLHRAGISAPIPHLNKTSGPGWLDNYTPALADIVEKAYIMDYRRFLYENPYH